MIRKNNKRGINFSRFFSGPIVFTFLGLVVFLFLSFSLYQEVSQKQTANKEITDLNNEVSSLETSNQDLKNLLTYLKSDQFVEAEARASMGLKKQGEEVIVVQGSDDNATSSDATNNKDSGTFNPFKWWQYFLGKK